MLSDFKKFVERINNFVTKEAETFSFRFLMEAIYDESFMDELNYIMDFVNIDRTADEIENLFEELRYKSNIFFEMQKQTSNSQKSLDFMLRGLAYFCLVETLNENSLFSESIIEKIKSSYGPNYLDIIQKIDKEHLSIDGEKFLESEKSNLLNNEIMKLYILMKSWQDKQRTYSLIHIRPLYELEKQYLGKSEKNLMKLHKAVLIKRAFNNISSKKIIGIGAFSKFYLAGLKEELIEFVGGKAYGLIVLNANDVKIPKTFIIPIDVNLDEKSIAFLNNGKKYAIRSSANVEDGNMNSFAGMFESYLDTEYSEILTIFEKVKNSINNNRVKNYIDRIGIELPKMAVVIQEFIEPKISGVWFGTDINSGMLEWVNGNAEKLVSGMVNPYRSECINGNFFTNITEDIKQVALSLLNIQSKLSNDKNFSADIEWCVIEKDFLAVQYRPVTIKINIDLNSQFDIVNEKCFFGIPAAAGRVENNAKFMKNVENFNDWNEGDILMAWFTDPDWFEIMSKSSGLVTAVGGLLCHSAIIAREIGIPCITGIGSYSMKSIWNAKKISIDGYTGKVRIVE